MDGVEMGEFPTIDVRTLAKPANHPIRAELGRLATIGVSRSEIREKTRSSPDSIANDRARSDMPSAMSPISPSMPGDARPARRPPVGMAQRR